MTPELVTAYKHQRLAAYPAGRALEAYARAVVDVANKTPRYGGNQPRVSIFGQPFKAYGADQLRWCERANETFRFVGLFHEILDLKRTVPTGFYTNHHCDEIVTGGVYQISGANHAPRFIAAIHDPHNDGAILFDAGVIFEGEEPEKDEKYGWTWDADARNDQAAIECATHALNLCASYADQEREYQSAWLCGQRVGEFDQAAQEAKAEFLRLKKVRRASAETLDKAHPAIIHAVNSQLRELVKTWCDNRAKAFEIETTGSYGEHWFDSSNESHMAAFEEGKTCVA